MKKIVFILITLISIFVYEDVFAASGNLSVSSNNVYVDNSFTVYANINSAAAWNIHVTASGPVSGCTINQADATADAMDTSKTFSTSCTATGEGTIIISMSGDVTSASDGNSINISGTKNVTVSKKSTSSTNVIVDNKSKNNRLKELLIEGYQLTKIDTNNYSLIVGNDVTNINVKATSEDSKTIVTGLGNHELNIGENNIEILAISESGLKNKINIKIIRKDGYYLEDLESLLNNSKIEDINIILDYNSVISSDNVEKIKNSSKTVKFNYYDENKQLLYSWIMDGSKIKNSKDLVTTIFYETTNKDKIAKLSNYSDNLIINQKNNYLLEGIKIKFYVGNKYNNNDIVNYYCYTKESINLIKKNIKVEEGFIEFNPVEGLDYILTMSNIPNLNLTVTTKKSTLNIITIVMIVESILLFVILIFYIIKHYIKKTN